MKQRKIIIRLGIASMILFTFQSANAQDIRGQWCQFFIVDKPYKNMLMP
jgi:hypothetical protein